MQNSVVINEVAALGSNQRVKSMFIDKGYDVCRVAWEDTGRYHNSCWGSNISDQTLVVPNSNNKQEKNMPMIRKPNFSDATCDVDIKEFSLFVKDEDKKDDLKTMSLQSFLEQKGWFSAERDSKILVSTQACFLPLTEGCCEFGVKIYNYQTSTSDPTLACIVSSAQGTSCAPITQSYQTLYFNDNGRAKPFEAKRLEEDRKERKVQNTKPLELTKEEKQRNMLLIYHVPLKKQVKIQTRCFVDTSAYDSDSEDYYVLESAAAYDDVTLGFGSGKLQSSSVMRCMSAEPRNYESRGFDAAVLRVANKDMGAYPQFHVNQKYERDFSLPIRCTIQYYVGVDSVDGINQVAVEYIVDCLKKVQSVAAPGSVGSLVTDDPDHIMARTTASVANVFHGVSASGSSLPFPKPDQSMTNF